MGDYTTIASVGDTIIELLRENLKDLINPDSIVMISPGEIKGNDSVRLSLFLYQILENASIKNREMIKTGPQTLKYPPMTLDLYYMLTSYPSSGIQDMTERTKEEHSVLGRAMQILSDNAILKGPSLKGSLTDDNEELHITLTRLDMDDITNIWSTFKEKPFRPSVCYLVTPVMIDSTRKKEAKHVEKLIIKDFVIGKR